MSVRVSTWVWHETTAAGSDLLVLLALADCANDDGECFPGVEVLVDKTRMSRATVFRRLDALEEGGLLERIRRGNRQSNVYRIRVPWAGVTASTKHSGAPDPTSQSETSPTSHPATSDVSPVRHLKSHGRDFQGTVIEPSGETSQPRTRGSRIPESFALDDGMRAWAIAQGWGHLDLEAITAEFVDYWIGVAGRQGVKLNWLATWRNRVRHKAQQVAAQPRSSSAWDRAREVGAR